MSNFTPTSSDVYSEAAIFARVVDGNGELSRELAEHVLALRISASDRDRISELLERNAAAGLSDQERSELDNFNHVADLVSLWQSRARRVLKSSE